MEPSPASPVAAVLARLDAAKRNGAGWSARCPAHDDAVPSLSVSEGRDGRVLLHCHAGCTPEAVLGALDMTPADLFPAPAPTGADRPEVVATYRYTDEHGNLLFEVVRLHPKSFRQRVPDGRGGWVWRLGGVRRVLYRLPDVARAVREGRTVYVVEGEKDADRLAGLGVCATTAPGGAGKWRDDYTETLRGARVVVLPDNDEPGRAHAEMVARALRAVSADVRVVHLPGLPEKGDVSDWFDAGGTVEELEKLAGQAEPADDGNRLPSALPVAELPPPEPIAWTVSGLILAGDINLAVADGGVGKTTLAIAIAAAKTVGRAPFDKPQFKTTPGPILFVSEEDPSGVIVNRLDALTLGHGWDRNTVRSRFHVLAQEGVSLDSPEWQAHLLSEVRRIGAELVVFDPLAELTTAAENSNDEVKPVIRFLRRLAVETGAGVLLLHHLGKAAEGKRRIDRIRGASAFHAAARSILFLEADDLGVRVEVVKSNRGEPPAPFVVERTVESEPGNPAEWTRARMCYQTQRQATENAAEKFIRETLEREGRLNTTQLKERAKSAPGVNAFDVTDALRRLQNRGVIDYEPGHKGAKLWGLACSPVVARQPRQPLVASLPEVARQPEISPPVVAPLYRGQPAGNDQLDVRQPDTDEPADTKAAQTYPCAECGRHRFAKPGTLCFGCRRSREAA